MSRRRVRLGEQLRRELSLKIATTVRDPDVGPLSITDVEVTADLWLARVYVAPHGTPEEQERTMAALARSASFLRTAVAQELHVRRMPELRFLRDDSAEAGSRIEQILQEVLPPKAEAAGNRAPGDKAQADESLGGEAPADEAPADEAQADEAPVNEAPALAKEHLSPREP